MPHPMFAASAARLLLDVSLKSLPLFAIAGLACLGLRRATAAARHTLWLLMLTGLLCLPFFCALLPRWSAPVLPAAARPPAIAIETPALTSSPQAVPASPLEPASQMHPPPVTPHAPAMTEPSVIPAPAEATVAAPPPAPARPTTADWVCLAWLAGMLLVLGRTLLGLAAASRLVRRCRPVTDEICLEAASDARRALRIARPVFIHEGPVAVPMTCGVRRPLILLPQGAASWPTDRLRAVLLHESAHIQRLDWATTLLAQGVCALYWFHPLAWLAAGRLRAEAEAACDDLVLTHGVPAPDYAAHLLEIVRGLACRRQALTGTVAMAYRQEVSGRLRMILDPHKPRGGVSRQRLALAAVAVLVLLAPLAALRPVRAARHPVPVSTPPKAHQSVQTVSWLVTEQVYDAQGRREKNQEMPTTRISVRRNPPAVSKMRPSIGWKYLDDMRGSFTRTAQGNYLVRRLSPKLDGYKFVAPEADDYLHQCTDVPGRHRYLNGFGGFTVTPWQEHKAIFNGQLTHLFSRVERFSLLGPGKMMRPFQLTSVQNWVDANTGRLLYSRSITTSTLMFQGGHVVTTESDFRYNLPPPPGVFDWSPPPGAKVTNISSKQVSASPASPSAKAVADQAISLANLRRIGLGITLYVTHHQKDGVPYFPNATDWMDEIIPYVIPSKLTGAARQQAIAALFHDPAAPAGQTWSYAYNRALSGLSLAKVDSPATTVAVFESSKGTRNASDGGQSVPTPGWHTGGTDYLFTDGHAKWLGPGAARSLFNPLSAVSSEAIPVKGSVYDRVTHKPIAGAWVVFSKSPRAVTPGSVWPSSFTDKAGRFQSALYPGENYLMVLTNNRFEPLNGFRTYKASGIGRETIALPTRIIKISLPQTYKLALQGVPNAGHATIAFVPVARATRQPVFAASP